MLNHLPLALITAQRATEAELYSARPDAPVVAGPTPTEARPRVYRTRAALATTLARVADAVAPIDWASSHRTASSR